jgi:mRNA-degrading endonuclease RelE of RelBE toxin-antitoxin system
VDIIVKCIKLPQIQKDLKDLKKRFRLVEKDLLYAVRLLERGQTLPQTDPYPGFGADHKVFKTRVINVNTAKGKSSGYRLIYEDISKKDEKQILLIFLYDKHTCSKEDNVRKEVKTRLHSPEYSSLK